MRKFNVNVNGNVYSVEVEEVTEGGAAAAPVVQTVAPAAAPAPAAKPVVTGRHRRKFAHARHRSQTRGSRRRNR